MLPSVAPSLGASELRLELAGALHHGSAYRHVRPDRVADGPRLLRHAVIGAADHPVELAWKPARRRPKPVGLDVTAGAEHVRIGVSRPQLGEPVRLGNGIVVEKGEDRSARDVRPRLTGARETTAVGVSEHRHTGDLCLGAVPQLFAAIDDEDDLQRWERLETYRIDRSHEVVPALHGVRTDDHGYPFGRFTGWVGARDGLISVGWTPSHRGCYLGRHRRMISRCCERRDRARDERPARPC